MNIYLNIHGGKKAGSILVNGEGEPSSLPPPLPPKPTTTTSPTPIHPPSPYINYPQDDDAVLSPAPSLLYQCLSPHPVKLMQRNYFVYPQLLHLYLHNDYLQSMKNLFGLTWLHHNQIKNGLKCNHHPSPFIHLMIL